MRGGRLRSHLVPSGPKATILIINSWLVFFVFLISNLHIYTHYKTENNVFEFIFLTFVRIRVGPFLKFLFSILQQKLEFFGVGDMLVCFKLSTNVQCLLTPQITLNGPVKRQLERTFIQRLNVKSMCVLERVGDWHDLYVYEWGGLRYSYTGQLFLFLPLISVY